MVEIDEIVAKEPPEINPEYFKMPFNEEAIEIYLLSVYAGAITKENLSIEYHEKVGLKLEEAITIGLGGSLTSFNYTTPEYTLYRKMRENIFVFSAAKQYQQVRTMSQFISQNGVKSTYQEFKTLAGKVFAEYNDNYLRTEYVTAIGQAQMGKEWVEAEQKKDIIPYLQYRTQRDSRVRDEHAALDGITLPVDHPFWKTYMPKNGWRCRCFTVSKERAKVTDLADRDLSDLSDEKKFPKVFQMNPGIDGLVFNPKHHPYFFVARGDSELKKNSFNLPIP
jgi:SPP1 gp7 family putative phage head morphogenesis protein